MRILSLLFVALAALAVSACGFQPLYATPEGAKTGGFQNVALASVTAEQSLAPLITDAFYARQKGIGSELGADYDLVLSADELAQRLAVQIDASVTRFNYILQGKYILTRRSDGKIYRGGGEATASFNVVDSQYSTLFAEQSAKEKAARALMESIERDILLTLNDDAAETRALQEQRDRSIELRDEYGR